MKIVKLVEWWGKDSEAGSHRASFC